MRRLLVLVLLTGCVAGRRADGDRYMEQARYPAAAAAYGDVIERRPADRRALLGQATALLRVSRSEAALVPAADAAALGLPEGIALYAEALIRTGQSEAALAQLTDPTAVPGGKRLLAEALLSTGDLDGALAAALETTDKALLAWCALRTGDERTAHSAAQAALARPPEAPARRAELAGVLLTLGIDTAVEIPEEQVIWWWDEAALRLATGDREGTMRLLSRLAVARPSDPRYSGTLGGLWLQAGEPELARRALEDALALDPEQPEAWVSLALSCAAIEKFDCEAVAWEGRLALAPPLLDNRLLASRAWKRAGDPVRVAAVWRQATLDEPDNPDHPLTLARVYRDLGDLDSAIGYARRAWQLAPEDTERILFLGELLLMRGDKQAAARVYEAGRQAHPDDPRFRAGLQESLGYVP
ncbi:MAG: tetratricopeptide (TPR) repeat protein [Myxococcota bacterium]|jgi:tetratricopeptide (TPR) repeat protein